MRKPVVLLVAILCGLAAAIYVQQYVNRMPGSPGDPTLSLPPAILTPQELGNRQSLFDHQTLTGWTATGPAEVKDGSLVLGGENGAKVFLAQEIDIGQSLEFHFFQEGSGKAVIHLQQVFRDPRDPHANATQGHAHSLNISGHVHKRWHAAKLQVTHETEHMNFVLEYKPLRDDMGRSSSASFTSPSRHGCRCRVSFEVAPGSTIHLRNVTVAKPPPPKQP